MPKPADMLVFVAKHVPVSRGYSGQQSGGASPQPSSHEGGGVASKKASDASSSHGAPNPSARAPGNTQMDKHAPDASHEKHQSLPVVFQALLANPDGGKGPMLVLLPSVVTEATTRAGGVRPQYIVAQVRSIAERSISAAELSTEGDSGKFSRGSASGPIPTSDGLDNALRLRGMEPGDLFFAIDGTVREVDDDDDDGDSDVKADMGDAAASQQ